MNRKDLMILSGAVLAILCISLWVFISMQNNKKRIAASQAAAEERAAAPQREAERLRKETPSISVADARLKSVTATFVDARTLTDFTAEHILDAVYYKHATERDPAASLILYGQNNDDPRPYVLYEKLKNTNNAFVLDGGLEAWSQEGARTVSTISEPTIEDLARLTFVEPRDLHQEQVTNDQNHKKILVIDVRSENLYTDGHIPFAVHVPFAALEQRRSEFRTAREIYVYGNDDLQSFAAGLRLYELGYITAKTVKGGFSAWAEYAYPIVNADGTRINAEKQDAAPETDENEDADTTDDADNDSTNADDDTEDSSSDDKETDKDTKDADDDTDNDEESKDSQDADDDDA